MSLRFAISLALLPLVTACGGGGASQPKVQSASSKPALTIPRAPTRSAPPSARVQSAPGLEGVIGATPAELVRQFGTARLDVWEGDARKLQFAGDACVLDVYLYPASAGREVQATYVDARRGSDGQDVDRAACIAALRRR